MPVPSPRPVRSAIAPGRREEVLCIPRRTVFPDGAWHGLVSAGLERVLRTIGAAAEYRPRALVEDDPAQQQVIPYCIVRHADGTYLLTRRLRHSTEKRLHHLYSLGVGGHVNPGDGMEGDPVVGGLLRTWSRVSAVSSRRAVAVALRMSLGATRTCRRTGHRRSPRSTAATTRRECSRNPAPISRRTRGATPSIRSRPASPTGRMSRASSSRTGRPAPPTS